MTDLNDPDASLHIQTVIMAEIKIRGELRFCRLLQMGISMQSRYASTTMIGAPQIRCALASAALAVLAGCGSPPVFTASGLNEAYENALEATEPPVAIIFAAGDPAEQVMLERLEDFFAEMTPVTVRAKTAAVYASDGWLYDNLTAISGREQIEAYFVKAAGEVDALQVEFMQVIKDGPDYFVRWRMSIVTEALNDGAPIVSYGVTHFRFNKQGQVLVHRDFWDAGTGLYEYLPGLGGLIQRTRAALAGES
jgi:steroid delta-isomerase